jgi:hypothetical protein
MSRTLSWIAPAMAFAVLALGWNNVASARPGVCKPVRACEAVRALPSVPVCQPVKKIAPLPPVCQPVKACERVDGGVKHVVLRSHFAPALGSRVRLARHVVHRHGHEAVYAAPEGAAPAAAPQSPVPPAPSPAKA